MIFSHFFTMFRMISKLYVYWKFKIFKFVVQNLCPSDDWKIWKTFDYIGMICSQVPYLALYQWSVLQQIRLTVWQHKSISSSVINTLPSNQAITRSIFKSSICRLEFFLFCSFWVDKVYDRKLLLPLLSFLGFKIRWEIIFFSFFNQ